MGNSRNFIEPTFRIQISVVLKEYATFNCSHTASSAHLRHTDTELTLCVGVGVHPSIISWMADIVGMVIDTCTALVVHAPRLDRHDVPIVIVGKQDGD